MSDVLIGMDYINHDNLSIFDQQALTSFDWDFDIDFTRYVGYHPDMPLIKSRTTSLGPIDMTLENSPLTIDLRGFSVIQPGMTTSQNKKPITIEMQDFEDQSIKAWFLDWQNKMDSLATHKAYRRSDLMVDVTVYRLDSSQRPVWKLFYKNCLPQTTSYSEEFNSDKTALGKCSITLISEIMIPTPMNIGE